MLNKGILAASAIAGVLAAFAGTADAKTKIIIGVGVPGIYSDDSYPYDPYGQPDYFYGDNNDYRDHKRRRHVDDSYQDDSRLSCRQVRRSLRYNGWRNVEAQDCEGRYYSFIAWRHGRAYELRVSSGSGEIVSRDPL